jgi:hypothetical protein
MMSLLANLGKASLISVLTGGGISRAQSPATVFNIFTALLTRI